MITRLVQFFYPDLTNEQVKKFGILSITFFCIIGSYWMLRLLKDTIFFKIAFPETLGWIAEQGGKFQPIAKTFSLFVVFAMVLIYSKLVDMFKKQTLFYIICSFYTVLFLFITILLACRSMYGDTFLGWKALAALGWGSYFTIESFGSIIVALFWSFCASVTDTQAAKKGFPFIIAGAQFGSIGGSALNIFADRIGDIWPLFLLATIMVASVMFLIYTFIRVIPKEDRVDRHKDDVKKKEGFWAGFFGGLKLLLTRKYLFGILIVSTFYEIVITIIDYQMKRQASIFPMFASSTGYAKFLGYFGVCTNGLAFLMALLGTSYFMKKYGLKFCLLIFPLTLGASLTGLYLFYTTGPTAGYLLMVMFGVMMLAKGLSYSVNNPTKEMMYIPTSKDAKFKAKGWIDMFGGRTAKMTGARINNLFKNNLNQLMLFGTLASLGLIGIWIIAAIFVGNKNKKLVDSGEIVE